MAKRLKLRISRVLPFFQSCRSKDPSTLPVNPHPAFFRLSPLDPTTSNTDFPVTTPFPDPPPPPPPSKPRHSSFKRHLSSAIESVGCGCRSRSGGNYVSSDDNIEPPEYKWKQEEKWHIVARVHDDSSRRKIYNSSVSGESDGISSSQPIPTTEKKSARKQRSKKKKCKARIRISTSSGDSGWFSSEGGEENDGEETETLVSSSRSFSTDSSSPPHLETISESPSIANGLKRKKKNPKRVKRVKRHASKSKGLQAGSGKTKTHPSPESGSPARLSVFRKLIPCTLDGKVRESFAVVKRSEDPYEDFKRSMLEMIMEKQMFEARDLEQLLHCFLSLNSRHHHGVIVEAFSEIWDALFCKSLRTHLVSEAS